MEKNDFKNKWESIKRDGTFNPSSGEARQGESLWVQFETDLQIEFQASKGYAVRLWKL